MAAVESWSPDIESRVLQDCLVRSMGETGVDEFKKCYICSDPDCSASFNKAWKLNAHIGERPYACEYGGCGKGFTRKFHLGRHMLTHTGEKPFVCSAGDCHEAFTTNANLRKHLDRKHQNKEKPYMCYFEGCGKSFKKHQQLTAHECHHTNEMPYKCCNQGCEKSFLKPSKLKRHEKVHQGYACKKEDCQFEAKTWTNYQKHIRESHVEDHICEVCEKKLKRKDFLKQHQKTHLSKREVYKCLIEDCGRKYTTVVNLQSHILSFHEEARPFVCEHSGCGKTFVMKASLDRQAVMHDPEKRKLKVILPRPQRIFASCLSGYFPPISNTERDSTSGKLVEKLIEENQAPLSVETLTLS
ncbi:transcription factor IIIA-like [Lissotriton helveticus]